jgi:hypothetical protein
MTIIIIRSFMYDDEISKKKIELSCYIFMYVCIIIWFAFIYYYIFMIYYIRQLYLLAKNIIIYQLIITKNNHQHHQNRI